MNPTLLIMSIDAVILAAVSGLFGLFVGYLLGKARK